MTTDATPAPEFGPPDRDPWKGLRGVMAGTLVLEAIVVLLALPVVATTGGGLTGTPGTYVVVLGVAMVVMSGMQRRPWALGANLGLQLLAVAAVVFSIPLGAVGLLFAAVWAYLMYLRRDIQQRMASGRLPGQRG
jgi:hypothetical protein